MTFRDAIGALFGHATGIAHMHTEGYLHLDIKPANMFLHKSNGQLIGIVGDLGLAAHIPDNSKFVSHQHEQGTDGYRCHEPRLRAMENFRYSTSSDVYSFGMTMARTLTKSSTDLLCAEAKMFHKESPTTDALCQLRCVWCMQGLRLLGYGMPTDY
jgi:serine/threonine protein kinase